MDSGSDQQGQEEYVLFVGNVPSGSTAESLSSFFSDNGLSVLHVEFKGNFAFLRVPDIESREKAVRDLDKINFQGRQLSIQVARGDGMVKRRENDRKANSVPTETVFIVNFDSSTTNEDEIRAWVQPYGAVKNVEFRGTYAFVQFESIPEATEALNALHGTKHNGKAISVEYSNKDWNRRPRSDNYRNNGGGRRDNYGGGHRDGGYGRRRDRSPGGSPRRGRGRSPSGGGGSPRRGRGRSPSPRGGYGNYRGGGGGGGRSPVRDRSPSPPNYRAGRDRNEPYGRRDDYHNNGGNRGGNNYNHNDNYRRDDYNNNNRR